MDILAAALVAGIHLVSVHSEPTYPCDDTVCRYNNTNPGAYVRLDGGLTAGVYYNSYRQISGYVGWTWDLGGGLAVTAGGAVGYPHAPVMPVVIPSLAIPLVGEWKLRLSVIPKVAWPPDYAVAHASIERRW